MEYKVMKSSSMNLSFLASLFLAITLVANPVFAAEKKDKAARRTQQMIQQIQQEKTALQTQLDQKMQEKASLEADVAKEKEENAALKAKLIAANRNIDGLQISLKEITAERMAFEAKLLKTQVELEATKTAVNDLDAKYQGSVYSLKVNEQQRATLTSTLLQKSKVIDVCVAKNSKLYDYGLDLVKLYENPNRYTKVVLTEPFSQLKRAQLENILQDYNDKIDEQKMEYSK